MRASARAPSGHEHRWSPLSALLLIVAITGSVACGSTESSTSVGPSPAKCAAAVATSPSTFPAGGGSGELVVSSARECSWSVSSPDAWIALAPPTTGQGNGKVRYTVAANPAASARRGSLVLGSQAAGITQEAAPCLFELDPRSFELAAGEQTAAVDVKAPAGCAWAAKAAVSWIEIIDSAQGSGSGRLRFRVSGNAGAQPRSGSVDIAGLRVDIRQLASVPPGSDPPGSDPPGGVPPDNVPPPSVPPCSYDLEPKTADVGPPQDAGTVSLRTDAECAWTAVVDRPWLSVTTATGKGPADVRYQVAANSSTAARTAHITVNGSVFALRQAGCSYQIQPTSASVPAWGGSGRIDVQTQAPCPWSAVPRESWITITPQNGGPGSGGADYTLEPHGRLGTRTGIITVAGHDFTVAQDGATSISGAVHSVRRSCPNRRFIVHGQRILTTSATEFEGGTCGDILDGVMIRVKGIVGSDDVLTAIEVDFM